MDTGAIILYLDTTEEATQNLILEGELKYRYALDYNTLGQLP